VPHLHVLARDPQDGWWLVLTPACDLYEDLPGGGNRAAKAEYVRLAKAVPLSEAPLIARWIEAGSPGKGSRERNAALEMFRDNNARYRILPKYLDIPDLLVDFEIVQAVPLAEVRSWTRVATLDSPFAEAMSPDSGPGDQHVGWPSRLMRWFLRRDPSSTLSRILEGKVFESCDP
jgi:hypothetical protein